VLKNTAKLSKGESYEKEVSISFHSNGLPLLVSQKLLRQKGLGQVDMAKWSKDKITLAEVKCTSRLTSTQLRRLSASGDYLSNLLHTSCKFIFIHKAK